MVGCRFCFIWNPIICKMIHERVWYDTKNHSWALPLQINIYHENAVQLVDKKYLAGHICKRNWSHCKIWEQRTWGWWRFMRERMLSTDPSRWYSQAPADNIHRPKQTIFTCSSRRYSQAQADDIHMLKQTIFTGPNRWYSQAPADNIHRPKQTIFTCSSRWYSQAPADDIHMLKQTIFTGPNRRYSQAPADNIFTILRLLTITYTHSVEIRMILKISL